MTSSLRSCRPTLSAWTHKTRIRQPPLPRSGVGAYADDVLFDLLSTGYDSLLRCAMSCETQFLNINHCPACQWHAPYTFNGDFYERAKELQDRCRTVCPRCGEPTVYRVGQYVDSTPVPKVLLQRFRRSRAPAATYVRWKPEKVRPDDTAVLNWLAQHWGRRDPEFTMHVLKVGGIGDASDLREFVRSELT
jgi:hypothetical protein